KAAICMSKRELQSAIASKNPDKAIQERLWQVSQNFWKLELGLNRDQQENLRRVQDLESTRRSKPATLVESLDASLECYLEKRDPIRKARRAWRKKARQAEAKIRAEAKLRAEAR